MPSQDSGKSATGAAPGPASRPVARPADSDPQQAELESLRRLLAERDGELLASKAELSKYSDQQAFEQRIQHQIDSLKESNLTAERLVNASRTPDQAKQEGYAALLQQSGVQARPEKPTSGLKNPLPVGHIYRLTAPAVYPPDHPFAGQRCYNGITCVLVPPDSWQTPLVEEARQHCIRFQNGIGLTDDRDAAWQMARDYGYSLEVETQPVIQVQRPTQTFEPILDRGKLVGAPQ